MLNNEPGISLCRFAISRDLGPAEFVYQCFERAAVGYMQRLHFRMVTAEQFTSGNQLRSKLPILNDQTFQVGKG